MTTEEINKTICEICGWDYKPVNCGGTDCCNDLNVVYEAEQYMWENEKQRFHTYWLNLGEFWVGNNSNYRFHATAYQRAVAFLKTFNKWKESK